VRLAGASDGSAATVGGVRGVGGVRLDRAVNVGGVRGQRGASDARTTGDAIGGVSGGGLVWCAYDC
jgi:hypothetical protein